MDLLFWTAHWILEDLSQWGTPQGNQRCIPQLDLPLLHFNGTRGCPGSHPTRPVNPYKSLRREVHCESARTGSLHRRMYVIDICHDVRRCTRVETERVYHLKSLHKMPTSSTSISHFLRDELIWRRECFHPFLVYFLSILLPHGR